MCSLKSDFNFKLNKIDFSNNSFGDDDFDSKMDETESYDSINANMDCKLIRSVSIYRRQQREVKYYLKNIIVSLNLTK